MLPHFDLGFLMSVEPLSLLANFLSEIPRTKIGVDNARKGLKGHGGGKIRATECGRCVCVCVE